MIGFTDPHLQVRALQELARKIPAEGKPQATMLWENEHGSAGVTVTGDRIVVFLFGGEQEVASMSEAGTLLTAIFADEVVVVRAYQQERFVHVLLAPASDPEAAFNFRQDEDSHNLDKPSVDYVVVETWSRGVLPEEE